MNLRFSSGEVRVRLERTDAVRLFETGKIQESFAYPGGNVRVEVVCVTIPIPVLDVISIGAQAFQVSISKMKLTDMFEGKTKSELECLNDSVFCGPGQFQRLRFEIDRFTHNE